MCHRLEERKMYFYERASDSIVGGDEPNRAEGLYVPEDIRDTQSDGERKDIKL